MGVRIIGTGVCPGGTVVRNEDLGKLGYDADWIVQRTGIKSRFHVAPGQATSDMAIGASKECLKNAGVAPEEIDLIILATMTSDHFTPPTSSLVQAALGCQCPAFDLNAACSGFMYSLVVAAQFVKTGSYKKVLVVCSETMSMVADPQDKKTYPLFGDGAAATIVVHDLDENAGGTGLPAGILTYRIASIGEMSDKLVVPGGGSRAPMTQEVFDKRLQYLKMDGRAVFKWAVRLIPNVVAQMLDEAKLKLEDVDVFIPHQANRRIIDAALEHLDIPEEKIYMNLDRYGNTSASSVPICIHEATMKGLIKPGKVVLLIGFGAGLTWGSCLLRW